MIRVDSFVAVTLHNDLYASVCVRLWKSTSR